MKISYNWLRTYLDLDLAPEELGEILTAIGLEVEGIEPYTSVPGGLEGIVIGQVLTCEKHPNADKLSLTTVDIGEEEAARIICGAPNVAAGQKVVVARVGATLYPLDGEPFQIKKAKIRGTYSHGMICAEDELGLGDDHSGIMVLPGDAEVGQDAGTYFRIEKDTVFDIGLTPNRSDATSHLGVAEDLSAYLRLRNENHAGVNYPDISAFEPDDHSFPFEVTLENPEACPRYSGLTISGIEIKPAPEWMQNRLRAIGVRPINNIVDITNYVLHEMGQPLHAFDADKIPSHHIRVKTLDSKTPFVTLDEVERKLDAEDLMICDGQSEGLCIAGVFGGTTSGVTEQTKRIFLESAHFHPRWIRKTSTRHQLRTDAAKCFEKTTDPNITVRALKRAALLMQAYAGGRVTSEIVDVYPEPIHPAEVTIRWDRVKRLIGMEIPDEDILSVLEALRMQVKDRNATSVVVQVPTNKADVTREADVIEEILRIYGFHKVPLKAKMENTLNYPERPSKNHLKKLLGDFLSARGVHEMMALSLSQSKYYPEYVDLPKGSLVYVNNTSNVFLDIMRPEMLISAMETVLHNQNRQQYRVRLYEFGRSYTRQENDKISENEHLTVTLSGPKYHDHWLDAGKAQDFYTLKKYVHAILQRVGISAWKASKLHGGSFAYGLQYSDKQGQQIVTFGKVNTALLKKFDLRQEVFFADFSIARLFAAAKQQVVETIEVSRYPSVRRDLALVVPADMDFEDLERQARKQGGRILKDVGLFDVYQNPEHLGEGKKSYAISLVFEDSEKTLKDSDIDRVIKKMVRAFSSQFGAELR